ncbi:unnamed protein product, partial [Mesorhabditis spiculigera]
MNNPLRCRMSGEELVSPRLMWETNAVDVVVHTEDVRLSGPKRTIDMPGTMGVPLDVYYRLCHDFDSVCAFDPVIRCGVGPSNSGKSFLLKRIVQWLDDLTDPVSVCQGILLCYSIDQPLYHELVAMDSRVRLFQGLPSDADIESLEKPHFIVIDDQCTELKRNKTVVDLFTKGVHHRNHSLVRLNSSRDRRRILRKASRDELGCLVESLFNVRSGNVPLHKYEHRKLKRHMETIDRLARQRQAEAARAGLVQSGDSILPIILPALIDLATPATFNEKPLQGAGTEFTRFTQDDADKQRLKELDTRMQSTLENDRLPEHVKTHVYNQLLAVFTDLLSELRRRQPQGEPRLPSPNRYPAPRKRSPSPGQRQPTTKKQRKAQAEKVRAEKAHAEKAEQTLVEQTEKVEDDPSPRRLRSGLKLGKPLMQEIKKTFPYNKATKSREFDGMEVPETELHKIVAHLNTPESKRKAVPPYLGTVIDSLEKASPNSPVVAQFRTPTAATPMPSRLFTPQRYSRFMH